MSNILAEEKYEFSWIGKREAAKLAETLTKKVFSEDKSDGVNCDCTENLFIEGDNIDGLKLLQKTHLGKVKMVYIDPPYNTGKDFVYRDDLKHSDWCSMMYPRLKLAKKLLSDDGVIFISIDDNELFNLKMICDEVFGEENFVNCIAVKMSEATGVKMTHQNKRFPKLKEYILFYKKKNFNGFVCIDKYRQSVWDRENNIFLENMTQKIRDELIQYKEKDELYQNDINHINKLLKNVKKVSLSSKIKELRIPKDKLNDWLFDNAYRIIKTVGSSSLSKVVNKIDKLPNQEIACNLSNDNVLFFYITDFNRDAKEPRLRVIFADENIYKNPCDFWQDIKTSGAIALEGGIKYKNGKKPLKLLTRLIKMTTSKNDIILDFFAGSGSTGHAVMEQNAQDNQTRKFILMQTQESLDENYKNSKGEVKNDISEAIKILDKIKKPHYITELSKERLRLSGNQVLSKNKSVDIGFKVIKIK